MDDTLATSTGKRPGSSVLTKTAKRKIKKAAKRKRGETRPGKRCKSTIEWVGYIDVLTGYPRTRKYRSGDRVYYLLKLIKRDGPVCVSCGLVGDRWGIERFYDVHGTLMCTHLNLYGFDTSGKRHFMTLDHVLPKSKGGGRTMKNLQIMCETCNSEKGNKSDVI